VKSLIVFFALSLVLLGHPSHLRAADPIKEINARVEKILQQIKSEDLPVLNVKYDYKQPTEGVPPSFKFYFNRHDEKLVACEIHIGHETWAKSIGYYFDFDGHPMKYRETSSHQDPQKAWGIIFGAGGKVLWKNTDAPHLSPKDIQDLYSLLRERLAAVH
jgi:hypothetical protein